MANDVLRRFRRKLTRLSLAVGLGLAAAGPLWAQTPDAAVNGWIAGLKAQGLDVVLGAADADRAAKSVTLRNVKISSGGVAIAFGRLSLAMGDADGDQWSLRHVEGEDLALSGGALNFKAKTFQGDGLAIARVALELKDPARPAASLIALARDALKSSSGPLALGGVELSPSGGAGWSLTASRASLDSVRRGALAGLKLADVKWLGAPGGEPLTMKTVAFGAISLGLAVDLLDPRSALNASPSRDWASLVDQIAIDGLASSSGDSKTGVDHIDVAGVKLRKLNLDLARLFGALAADPAYFQAHPDEARQLSTALAESVAVDSLAARQADIQAGAAAQNRHLTLGQIAIHALDPDAIGEIDVSKLNIAQNGATTTLDQLTLTKLEMVANTPTPAAPAPTDTLGAPQIAGRTPYLGAGSAQGLQLKQADGATISVASASFSAPSRVRTTPTRIVLNLTGVKFPSALLPATGLLEMVRDVSPETLSLDADLAGGFDESGSRFAIDRLTLDAPQLTKIEFSLSLVDTPAGFDNYPTGLIDKLAAGSLDRARFRMTDDGLAARVLAKFAEANKMDPDQLKRSLSANLPIMLGSIPDASARNSLIFALVGFLNDPQIVEFNTGVATPLPMAKIFDALKTSPALLPGLVRLNARYSKKN